MEACVRVAEQLIARGWLFGCVLGSFHAPLADAY